MPYILIERGISCLYKGGMPEFKAHPGLSPNNDFISAQLPKIKWASKNHIEIILT